MARPGMGTQLIERLDGDPEAKRRVSICIQTISGAVSVEDARQTLGLCKQAFHELRERILRGAITGATPKPGGRPAHPGPTPEEVADLKRQLERQAKDQQILAEGLLIREELSLTLGNRTGDGRLRKLCASLHDDANHPDQDGKKGRLTTV
jgi:hypothetical protein